MSFNNKKKISIYTDRGWLRHCVETSYTACGWKSCVFNGKQDSDWNLLSSSL